jgi:hypothetical protein
MLLLQRRFRRYDEDVARSMNAQQPHFQSIN